MKMQRLLLVSSLTLAASLLDGQALDPKTLTLFDQPGGVWPTYNGDYSGRRFSELNQINQSNIDNLKIEWMYRITGIGPQRGVGNPTIKSTPLMVNGILYFTIPDHVFAVNARTGEHLWQYDFEDHGGHLVGQRGVGMYGNWLYFMTPDGWFISLNSKDRQGALAQESRRREAAILHHHGADDREEPRDWSAWAATPWTCAAIWKRAIRRPASCNGAGGREPQKPGDPGLGYVAQQSRHGSRRRHDLAARHVRSGAEPAVLGHRQREPGIRGPEPQGRQPVDGVDRRAESRLPASWPGGSRLRRTIRTTGTTWRRRCCSMR